MKKLIINADDFGLTPGVCQGILELNQKGIVKSTTALVNSPYFVSGIEAATNYPSLGIGIHLALDIFTSESLDPSICQEDGRFYSQSQLKNLLPVSYEIIYQEWQLQIEKFIAITGKLPTHIDSHHHVHLADSVCEQASRDLANYYNIPLRDAVVNRGKSVLSYQFYNEGATLDNLKTAICKVLDQEADYYEIFCHGAIVDDELMAISSYNTMRKQEYQILNSDDFAQFITDNQIKLTNFSEN